MKITGDGGRDSRAALGVGAAGAVLCLIAAGLAVAGPAGADPSGAVSDSAQARATATTPATATPPASATPTATPAATTPTATTPTATTPTASKATATTVTSSGDAMAGVATTVTAKVSPVPDGGTVSFAAGGSAINGCGARAVDAGSGKATCSTAFNRAGSTSITATFSGTDAFAASHGDLALPVAARESGGTSTSSGASGSGTADLAAAVHYLTSATSANGVENGTSLAADGYFDTSTDWADFGLTIDGAFALAATGLDNTTLAKVAAFLAEQKTDPSENSVNNWTGIGTEFASGGSIGKEALLAEVTGYNPRNFGGHDLIAALDALVCSGTDSAKGCAGKGNYAYATSTFSQALGLIAQLRAGDTANATDAVTYLEGLQNAAGAWPTLTPNTGGGSDVDSTAMAAMALALLGDDGTASAAVTKAVDWIATQQETDGGFPGTSGDSTNSAALAIQGLTLAGSKYQDQIDRAKTFLAGQQNSDGGFNAASQQGSDVRASTQVVSGLVGTSFGTLSDNIAPAATADRPAAAAYLTGQLVDGTHLNFADGSTPNYGGTADLAMALAAAGGQDATLVKVVTYLRAHVADYADPAGATASFPGPYSGSAAKLALLAEITGQDPSAFGGFDLVAALTDHVCTAADATGSCTAAGDFYQAFSGVSQALGVLALARADRTPPAAAVTRLEQLQCPDGGFSSDLIAPGADCTSDVDTTGYAVQALTQVPDASNAVSKAMSYLLAAQQSDGGYLGAAGENSNSTALAAQGLMAAPAASTLRTARSATARARATAAATPSDAVTVAVAWLAARQNADGGLSILAAGASDPSATAQALVPLAGKTQADLNNPITLAPFTGSGPTSSASPSGGTSPASGGTVPNGSPTVGSPTAGGSGVAGSTDAGSGPLAFTGSGVAGWLTWAGLLLITGAALVVAGRRRWPAWASPGWRP